MRLLLPTHVFWSAALGLFLLSCSDGQLPECVMRQGSTCACDLSYDLGYIDLSPLTKQGGPPAFYITTQHHYNYWYNPCYSFTQECSGDVAVCQKAGKGVNCGKQSTGTITIVQTSPQFLAMISYTGGDNNRVSFVRLFCDPSKDNPSMVFDAENPQEHYNFNLTSKYCCPQPNPTQVNPTEGRHHPEDHKVSLGTILDVILLVVVVSYLVAGVVFMRFRRGATGKDMIPNLAFWMSLPGLIKDGGVFIVHKVRRDPLVKSGYSELN